MNKYSLKYCKPDGSHLYGTVWADDNYHAARMSMTEVKNLHYKDGIQFTTAYTLECGDDNKSLLVRDVSTYAILCEVRRLELVYPEGVQFYMYIENPDSEHQREYYEVM